MSIEIHTIKKRSDFLEISKKAKKFVCKSMILLEAKQNSLNICSNVSNVRIGLTVSKKIGNAVNRNFVKRRLKSAYKEAIAEQNLGYEYVIIARKTITNLKYSEYVRDLKYCLTKISTRLKIK